MLVDELYQFRDPREVLVWLFQSKKGRNPAFSVRAWSKKLGFKNPSLLSDILNGKRRISPDVALRISENLEFDDNETRFFQSLVFLSNAKSESERTFYETVVEKFMPERHKKVVSYSKFPELKEWYYGVLDEMTCLADFKEDFAYLAKRLGPDVTPQGVELALKDLVTIGLIGRDSKGRLKRPKKWSIKEEKSPEKTEHAQVRKYKKTFLEKGLVALENQRKSESYFRQTNVPIVLKNFEKVTDLADGFFDRVYDLENNKQAEEVFHVGILCYRLTEPNAKERK
jgi:uncharacterized protein (TIGR02147 family)